MGFNRVPHYSRGVLLVGDTGGMVNPFNGEGSPTHESGDLRRNASRRWPPPGTARERVLANYPSELKARYGGYYRLGNAFVSSSAIRSHADRHQARHATPDPHAVCAEAPQPHGPARWDAMDRVINAMTAGTSRLTPKAWPKPHLGCPGRSRPDSPNRV